MKDFAHKKTELEPSSTFAIGQEVRILGTNLSGIIIKANNDLGKYVIEVGGKNLKIEADRIGPKKSKNRVKNSDKSAHLPLSHGKRKSDRKLKLDLHRMTRAQAREALIELLNRALLENVHELEIIHGHGTGAIKAEVVSFLETSPHVATFKLMETNSGTTIAYLS